MSVDLHRCKKKFCANSNFDPSTCRTRPRSSSGAWERRWLKEAIRRFRIFYYHQPTDGKALEPRSRGSLRPPPTSEQPCGVRSGIRTWRFFRPSIPKQPDRRRWFRTHHQRLIKTSVGTDSENRFRNRFCSVSFSRDETTTRWKRKIKYSSRIKESCSRSLNQWRASVKKLAVGGFDSSPSEVDSRHGLPETMNLLFLGSDRVHWDRIGLQSDLTFLVVWLPYKQLTYPSELSFSKLLQYELGRPNSRAGPPADTATSNSTSGMDTREPKRLCVRNSLVCEP